MPRRHVITDAQFDRLLALPTGEADLIQHYTLSQEDLDVIARRRRPQNRLGFALQLCALRYPGRLIRPAETVPMEVARFLGEQLDIDPAAIGDYATRPQTRYDQLDTLRELFGFRGFTQPDHRALSQWLLPIAMVTVSAVSVAEALMVELRRQGIAAPGVTVIDRMVATAMLGAERKVAEQLTLGLSESQRGALDALLDIHAETAISTLAWARQSPGAPSFRALARLIEQLDHLRLIELNPGVRAAVHPDRVKQLAPEGARLTAQHLRALAERNHALMRRIGPLFLGAFTFQGVAAASGLVRAIEMLRPFYAGNRRVLPKDLPTGFIRRGWRQAVMPSGKIDGAAYELCFFAELRDRLRAGDIWVAGSRQYRAVEDQLIAKPLFAAMKEAGPLPVSALLDCTIHLQQRQDLLNERLRLVADKARRDQLEDVRLSGSSLKITPLQAVTPEAAELLADRLYGLLPKVRITDLLSEVAAWTGFSDCFTHLRSGLPFEDTRVILTTVLADATNLGLTGMAEACSVATYKQLVWTGGWHLREETYGRALARIVSAQQADPLAAAFGEATTSSSDG